MISVALALFMIGLCSFVGAGLVALWRGPATMERTFLSGAFVFFTANICVNLWAFHHG